MRNIYIYLSPLVLIDQEMPCVNSIPKSIKNRPVNGERIILELKLALRKLNNAFI